MADKILIDYEVEIKDLKAKLTAVEKSLQKVENEAAKSAKATEEKFKNAGAKISDTFTKVAGAIGIAFGTQQIIQFAKESVQLAAKAEGIKKAFDKLNNKNLLNDLREATKGTVSDLELMKAAVKANNFQLPLDQLATLLKFAQQRAQETGESVEYLTESIVLGISRKSIPILDNLGISSQQVQNEFKKTGDFAKAVGNIVNKSLEEQGTLALTTADKMAKLSAQWENLKVATGDSLIDAGDQLIDWFEVISGQTSFAEKNVKDISNILILAQEKVNADVLSRAQENEKQRLVAIKVVENEIKEIKEKGLNTQDLKAKQSLNNLLTYQNKFLNELKNLNKKANESVALTPEQLEAIKKAEEKRLEEEKKLRDLRTQTIKDERKKELVALSNKLDDDLQLYKGNNELQLQLRENFRIEKSAIDKKYDDLEEQERIRLIAVNAENEEIAAESLFGIKEWLYESNKALDEKEKKEAIKREKEKVEEMKRLQQDLLSFTANLANSLSEIQQNRITAQLDNLQAQSDEQKANLDKELEYGLLSRQDYDKKINELNAKQAEKEKELKIKAFNAQKQAALIQAAISTAQGILNALNVPNPTLVPIYVALAAATGAAQTAIIASQPTPKFAKGGEIGGRLHTQGGTLIEAEKGEYIINRKDTNANKDLLKAVNKGLSEKYIFENYIAPALKAQHSEYENNKNKSFADNIANSMIYNTGKFNDRNLLESLKQSRRADKENVDYLAKAILKQHNSRNW